MFSIQVMLSLAASLDLKIEQLDIKTTFSHGDLEEENIWSNLKGLKL